MKKLLLASVTLLIFSISILIFQLSCTKVSLAKGTGINGGEGMLILYVDHDAQASTNARTFWLMDSNGSNRQRVNIVLPSSEYSLNDGRLVESATHIIFSATKSTPTDQIDIVYKCNIDGTGLTELFRGGSYTNHYELSDAY
jgi:hypothetical protein